MAFLWVLGILTPPFDGKHCAYQNIFLSLKLQSLETGNITYPGSITLCLFPCFLFLMILGQAFVDMKVTQCGLQQERKLCFVT